MATCSRSVAILLTLLLFVTIISLVLLLSSSPNSENQEEDALVEKWIQCVVEKQQYPTLGSEYQIPDIYTRKNSSFLEVLNLRAQNLRYTGPQTNKPLVIVAPKDENVVPRIIKCTRSHGLKIRIRSGGHEFEGISYTAPFGEPFILLDMSNLSKVDVDIKSESATAWVQSGATLGQIYYWIAKKSDVYAFPGGVCPTVGAGGHISGGGYGVLMRKYGLSVDNIEDARIVDAEGRVLDSETMGKDLFWAIRGGGGSSFGVILAWKIKLVPVPKTVTVFDIQKDILAPGVNDILYKFQDVAHQLPKELFVKLHSTFTAPPNDNLVATANFTALFLGNKESLVRIMGESFPELGLNPEQCEEMSWIDSVLYWSGFPKGTPHETLRNYTALRGTQYYLKIKADFVKTPIPEDDLSDLWTKIRDLGMYYFRMEWSPYGGRMGEIGESDLPYSHRKGNLYSVFYVIGWKDDNLSSSSMDKSRELYTLMKTYVSESPRESLFNYFDMDLDNFGEIYFGKNNFAKLVEVKTRVDQFDFFSHQHSIPTMDKLKSWSSRQGSSHDAFSAAM